MLMLEFVLYERGGEVEVKGREVKREKWRLLAGRISTDHLLLSWKSMDEEIQSSSRV